jgi:RHS repeat-associated protein
VDAAGATHQYAYNAESQLVAVDGGVASYQYDGDGERAVKNLQSGGTLYWPGPDGALLAESDLAGNLTAEYVYFGGQRIARTDYTSGSATLKYYLTDRLGSTIGVVDATFANVLEDSDYYPYGREIPVVSSDSNHYKFTGKERDAETGYDYLGARYHGSNTGRWMTPDWAAKATAVPYADFGDPQSLNLYAYLRNNPTANSDPTGHNIIADGLEQRHVWGTSSGITFRDSGLAAEASLNTFIAAALEAVADAAAEEGATEQQTGPFMVTDPNSSEFQRDSTTPSEGANWPLIGSGECVASTEHFATGLAGSTTDQWREGIPLVLPDGTLNPAVKPNTAIATFDSSGHYPLGEHKNSGIFLGPDIKCPGSAKILDQWNPKSVGGVQVRDAKPPSMRTMLRTGAGFSDNPKNYYVIMLAR